MSYTHFIDWMNVGGTKNYGVELRDCPDGSGRGLFTTREFRCNDPVICVPEQLIITAGAIADMPSYCNVFKRLRLKPFEALVYFFITEKQNHSAWAPYMQMLPMTFATPAVLYPDLEADDFPFDSRKAWCEQKNELKAMYKKLTVILPHDVSWNLFLWAWHVVNTRCIYHENKPHQLIDNSKGDALAIVPLIDMINHSNENQCYVIWDSKLAMYKVIASRMIRCGEQILICYGCHTNGSLWIEYGFYLEHNICNKVEISTDEFMKFASAAGVKFSEQHRKAVIRADLPCAIYASDWKPSYGFKANLAILKTDCSKLDDWTKVIYEEAENVSDESVLEIVRLLRDDMVKNCNRSPEEVKWLWNEQITMLNSALSNS